MSPESTQHSTAGPCQRKLTMWKPAFFQISIQGFLDDSWSDYFGTRAITVEQDDDGGSVTHFTTEPVDQPALIGMINLLNARGLPLLTVALVSLE